MQLCRILLDSSCAPRLLTTSVIFSKALINMASVHQETTEVGISLSAWFMWGMGTSYYGLYRAKHVWEESMTSLDLMSRTSAAPHLATTRGKPFLSGTCRGMSKFHIFQVARISIRNRHLATEKVWRNITGPFRFADLILISSLPLQKVSFRRSYMIVPMYPRVGAAVAIPSDFFPVTLRAGTSSGEDNFRRALDFNFINNSKIHSNQGKF